MPHTPQTAITRLIQSVTDARNIVAGDRVELRPHLVVLGPRDGLEALKAFRIAGGARVVEPARFVLFSDDNLPAADAAAAARRKQLHEAASQAGITRVIAAAGCEIAHVLQQALAVPGEVAVSNLPDIHLLGGTGALGLRVTVRDLAALMAGRPLSVTVPHSVRVDLTGGRQPLVSGRDVFFALRREVTRDRLVGRALEVGGAGLETLHLAEREELCAQAGHAGLAAALCLPGQASVAELNRRLKRQYTAVEPAKDAVYSHRATLDLAHVQLSVVPPEGPDHWRTAGEAAGAPVRAVIIRGAVEQLAQAAEIIKQRRIGAGVRCCMVPASAGDFAAALEQDVLATLIEAGVEVHPPGTSAAAILREENGLVTGVVAPIGCWRAGVALAATAACAGAIQHPEALDAPPQRDSKLSARRAKPKEE